jgi:hypothetical protein
MLYRFPNISKVNQWYIPKATDEMMIALEGPSFLIRMYKITPLKISSSKRTDFRFHQIPLNKSSVEKRGFNTQLSLPKYIRRKKPEEQLNMVTAKKMKNMEVLSALGFNPNTDKFSLQKNQINNQEMSN